MKTFLIKTLALTFAVIGSYSLKSQIACPYTINNNLGCDVVLSIQFYDGTWADCPPCGAAITVTVPANTPGFSVTCPCTPACDISITVIGIAGPCATAYTSGTGSPASPFVPLPNLPPCCNAGPGAHLNINTANCDINP